MTKTRATTPRSSAVTPLSERQQQVFALVARGLTNKEIGFSLGITERGVAAQVSRMLAKFGAPNRAGLIARVLSEDLGALSNSAAAEPGSFELTADMRQGCRLYDASTFMVGLTLGPDNLIVYVNAACRNFMGIDVETRESGLFRARRESVGTLAFVAGSKAAFKTGALVTIESQGARWLRDDGSWGSSSFSCLLQPVHRARVVIGVLWICSQS